MSNLPDDIVQSQQGDAAAFGRLVRAHYAYAYALAFRLVCDEDEARDVVQEAFVRVWQHLDRFDPATRFTTWLYRIVSNLALDALRSRKRRAFISARIGEESDPPDSTTPELLATNRDIGRAIARVAGDLPETQRLVFTLRDVQDLSIEEVCEITGLSSESVRSNLHYARRKLRERLESDYGVRGASS
jgi:RNA polymerase sigma-70 factor (ECF subfamily)